MLKRMYGDGESRRNANPGLPGRVDVACVHQTTLNLF